MEFRGTPSLKSLRYVGHNRNSRSSDLIAKCEVMSKGARIADSVDLRSEHPSALPRDEILKAFDGATRTHHSSLMTHHFPRQTGSRFSRNAVMPSLKSSLM